MDTGTSRVHRRKGRLRRAAQACNGAPRSDAGGHHRPPRRSPGDCLRPGRGPPRRRGARHTVVAALCAQGPCPLQRGSCLPPAAWPETGQHRMWAHQDAAMERIHGPIPRPPSPSWSSAWAYQWKHLSARGSTSSWAPPAGPGPVQATEARQLWSRLALHRGELRLVRAPERKVWMTGSLHATPCTTPGGATLRGGEVPGSAAKGGPHRGPPGQDRRSQAPRLPAQGREQEEREQGPRAEDERRGTGGGGAERMQGGGAVCPGQPAE